VAWATYSGDVGRVLIVVIVVVLTVYTLFDVIAAERQRVRGMPKPLWALLAFVPLIGPGFWLALGRPQSSRGQAPGQQRRTVAPDDDPDFLWRIDRRRRQKPDDDAG
jgi:hypothetical protein